MLLHVPVLTVLSLQLQMHSLTRSSLSTEPVHLQGFMTGGANKYLNIKYGEKPVPIKEGDEIGIIQ